MKIKNSLTSVKTKPLIYLFLIVAVAGSALRSFQMFKYIEAGTGFNIGPEWLMWLVYGLIFVGCFVFLAVSFLSKDTENHQPEGIKSTAAAVFAMAFAFACLSDGMNAFFDSLSAMEATAVGSGVKGMMASGFLTGFLHGIFALFTMIYFIIFAFDMKRGSCVATRFKLLALAPTGWCCVRLVHGFISQISFLRVSDLFLELVMLSFMAMFFMAFAQVVSGVGSTGFSWRLTGFGLSAALIAAVINFARGVVSFVNGSSALSAEHPFSGIDLVFALFAVSLVYSLNANREAD